VLRSLHRHENDFRRAPEDLQKPIRQQIEHLISYHERILLQFTGKTRPDLSSELTEKANKKRKSLSEAFMAFYERDSSNYKQWLHLFPTVALIIDYHEHLIHLDKLVCGFQTFHEKDNQMKLDEIEQE
jgi:uncharacterized membrane protein YgaE (UPF0421/DUF939 family)